MEGQVLDLVAAKGARDVSDDGEDEQSYLIGLGEGFEVLIVHLDDSGAPDKYAVVDSAVNWNGADESDRVAFGAAFAYDTADGGSIAMFAAMTAEPLPDQSLQALWMRTAGTAATTQRTTPNAIPRQPHSRESRTRRKLKVMTA